MQFRKYNCLLFAVLAALPGAYTAEAAEPWTKDYRQWTPAEVQQVLTASPWARQTGAVFDNSLLSDERGFTGPPLNSAAATGMAGARAQNWDGGPGHQRGSLPTLPVTIRWESALPVQQALERSQLSRTQTSTAYVITLIGLWPGEKKAAAKPPENFEPPGRPDDAQTDAGRKLDAPQDLGHMREELMNVAKLVRRGKPPILPEDVKLDPVTGAISLLFPKTSPITKEDREVVFETRFGPMQVEQRFRLKEMVLKGMLEL